MNISAQHHIDKLNNRIKQLEQRNKELVLGLHGKIGNIPPDIAQEIRNGTPPKIIVIDYNINITKVYRYKKYITLTDQ